MFKLFLTLNEFVSEKKNRCFEKKNALAGILLMLIWQLVGH